MDNMEKTQQGPIEIFCDNKFAIAIAKNPIHHSRTKNKAIKYHFQRKVEAIGEIEL